MAKVYRGRLVGPVAWCRRGSLAILPLDEGDHTLQFNSISISRHWRFVNILGGK